MKWLRNTSKLGCSSHPPSLFFNLFTPIPLLMVLITKQEPISCTNIHYVDIKDTQHSKMLKFERIFCSEWRNWGYSDIKNRMMWTVSLSIQSWVLPSPPLLDEQTKKNSSGAVKGVSNIKSGCSLSSLRHKVPQGAPETDSLGKGLSSIM